MTTNYDQYDQRIRNAWKREKEVVKDGEQVRVPIQFTDDKSKAKAPPRPAFRHADARPHAAVTTDAERERRQKLYSDRDAKLSSAWKQGADQSEGDDE